MSKVETQAACTVSRLILALNTEFRTDYLHQGISIAYCKTVKFGYA